MISWRRHALPLAVLLGLLLARPACADEDQSIDATAQQALYLDALQALSEGRKRDASEMLARLVDRSPKHAGAWLDLALIQCGLGHSDEAERMFALIETRFQLSRELLQLIAEAREAGCTSWKPASSTTFVAGRGIDQNVNQGTFASTLSVGNGQVELPLLSEFQPKHDQYSVLGVEHTRELTSNGTLAFVQLQQRHNDHEQDYDSNSLFAGIDSPWQFGKWAVRTTATGGLVGLGGRLYQRQLQLQAQVTPPLSLPGGAQFSMLGGASHTDYLTLTNFNSNTLELRAQLGQRIGELSLNTSFGTLDDRARDARPGGDRHGTIASVLLRRPLFSDLNAELGYTRQTWRSDQPYSPDLLIDEVRDQKTQVLRGSLTYRLNKNQSLVLDGRVVRNRENISIFQYNNRLIQLSWQWQGP